MVQIYLIETALDNMGKYAAKHTSSTGRILIEKIGTRLLNIQHTPDPNLQSSIQLIQISPGCRHWIHPSNNYNNNQALSR